MSPPDPPKRHPSQPDAFVGVEQPERAAVRHHPGVDGADQRPPQRRGTLPGGMAAIPASGEFAPTLPAPNPLQRQTVRRPTPPSAVAAARRSDPPAGIRVPPDETTAPSRVDGPGSLSADQTALLREELAKARARNAELEPLARGIEEAKHATYPPQTVQPRKLNPAPESGSAKLDRAIGGTVRLVLARYGWPALAALGIGGAVLKPAADPAKTDATLANTEAIKRELELTRRQLNGVLDREAALTVYVECLAEQQAEYFAQLTPAADKMGAAAPLKPWIDRCKSRKP